MLKKPEAGEILGGNDRFEGYCKDLADLIAKKLGINCKNNMVERRERFPQFTPFQLQMNCGL